MKSSKTLQIQLDETTDEKQAEKIARAIFCQKNKEARMLGILEGRISSVNQTHAESLMLDLIKLFLKTGLSADVINAILSMYNQGARHYIRPADLQEMIYNMEKAELDGMKVG